MSNSWVIVGGNKLHKENFIRQLNREGFTPKLEDILHAFGEDDNIKLEGAKNFMLTNEKANYNLPEQWDEAINVFRSSP